MHYYRANKYVLGKRLKQSQKNSGRVPDYGAGNWKSPTAIKC